MSTGDYKYEAQLLAEEIAALDGHEDFYSLSTEQQCAYYEKGMQLYIERKIDEAEGYAGR